MKALLRHYAQPDSLIDFAPPVMKSPIWVTILPSFTSPTMKAPVLAIFPRIIAALEALKPRVEQAVKSAALPVILSGDCSVALATVAGARRYFRNVSMIYMDRDADLEHACNDALRLR